MSCVASVVVDLSLPVFLLCLPLLPRSTATATATATANGGHGHHFHHAPSPKCHHRCLHGWSFSRSVLQVVFSNGC
ncbi:hypothetical protein SOVF_153480 isoform A [Spinacia oleracea]|nr:hypothetical protein SOVF_153480 isoform A [Spinacia oleracea]